MMNNTTDLVKCGRCPTTDFSENLVEVDGFASPLCTQCEYEVLVDRHEDRDD